MRNEKVLDSPDQDNQASSFMLRNTIFILLALMALNIILQQIMPVGDQVIYHLDGTVADANTPKRAIFSIVLIAVPIVGFILSLPVSLLPYQQLSYKKKYIRFALFIMLLLNGLFFLLSLYKLISAW